MKEIDLLQLTPEYDCGIILIVCVLILFVCSVDVNAIVDQIAFQEPLITESRKPYLKRLIISTHSIYTVYYLVLILVGWYIMIIFSVYRTYWETGK